MRLARTTRIGFAAAAAVVALVTAATPALALVQLRRGPKPGVYTASFRAVADDGHHERGTFTFRLR